MKLSIIVPVYNSSRILINLTNQIKKNLESKLLDNFEIIFINDCSVDESWFVIKNLSKKYSFIKGINLEFNVGQHGAIYLGLLYCIGEKIIIMDDDLQHPPSSLISIYNKLDNFDACYTIYKKRKHVLWKIIISITNNIFSSFIFDKPFNIYLSSLKGINIHVKNKSTKTIPKIPFIDSLILKNSKKISNINIIHQERFLGDSNYDLKKLFKLWFDMIENYHFYPLRFGSLVGLISYCIVKIIRIFIKRENFRFKIKEKTF